MNNRLFQFYKTSYFCSVETHKMTKTLLFIGGTIFMVGLVLYGFEKMGISYQNPLDFKFEKGQTKFYFPLGSSLILSVFISVLLYILTKLR